MVAKQAEKDPFAVVESEAPHLGKSEIEDIVGRHYGLEAEWEPLISERDQNFRLRCTDGRQFVLKVANVAEDRRQRIFRFRRCFTSSPAWQNTAGQLLRLQFCVLLTKGHTLSLVQPAPGT